MERNTAHAVLTSSMIVLGGTIIFSQGWWTGLRNFIGEQTQSGAKTGAAVTNQKPLNWNWVWGYLILWVALSFMVESQNFAELGAGFAVLVAMSAGFAYGPAALQNIGLVKAKGK